MTNNDEVWLVDDEVELTDLYSNYLNHSMPTRVFHSAAEALAAFEKEAAPSLIVSDIRMPGIDGLTFLEKIRSSSSSVPLVLLSAHADKEQAIRANRIRVHEILEKPCDPSHLKEVIQDAIRTKKSDSYFTSPIFDIINTHNQLLKVVTDRMIAAENFIYENKLKYPASSEKVAEYLMWQKTERQLSQEIERKIKELKIL